MKETFYIIFVILLSTSLVAQNKIKVSGKVIDSLSKKPLMSATITIVNLQDSSKFNGMSDKQGIFSIDNVRTGLSKIIITYIGYNKLEKELRITGKSKLDLGIFNLQQSEINTAEVEVTAQAPIGSQKQDTTEFNANAFKTQPDANAEDLVKKIPGVQVETDGTVKAQGEDVKKVLVDGKPFFGEDPTTTLRNLPADMVDRIQVYDRASDLSEFTGFDDGQTTKTMNIITKATRRQGLFGRFSGGGGTQEKYSATANFNIFDGLRRITILGMSNNINQQNFSIEDIIGALGSSFQGPPGGGFRQRFSSAGLFRPTEMRPAQGGFRSSGISNYMVGFLDGISSTHALGINYSDIWGESIEVTGSYFFNITNNSNDQTINREYILQSDSNQYYNQFGDIDTKNINHRFNFLFKYSIDSNNTLQLRPALTLQTNKYNNITLGENIINKIPLSSSDYRSNSDYFGYNFNNELIYRHRFIPGRTITFGLNTSINNKDGSGNLLALNKYYSGTIEQTDTINQKSSLPTNGYSITASLFYTEPFGDYSQFQLSYSASYNKNNSDKRTYNFNEIIQDYDILDSLLSNKFDNDYFTQKAGIGYRYKKDDINITALLNYQRADLISEAIFPKNISVNYKFDNLLPSLQLNYNFTKRTMVRVNYRTNTNAPSIQQLQNVIDNSNPLQLSSGNPDLKQQYSHTISSRFSSMSEDFNNIFMTFFMVSYRDQYIANSYLFAQRDTILETGIKLPAGGQISKPVNLDGYWNATTFINYGFPLTFISSQINAGGGFIYTRTPSLLNNVTNYSNSYNVNILLSINSNISQNLDFSIAGRANFNITKNTLRQNLDNNYNSYIGSIILNWIFWEGFFIQGDFRYQLYTGLTQPENNQYALLNFGIGKKLFDNNAGEIKLSIFDLLKQNKNVQTNVSDYYIEYSQNEVLKQYIMLTFTYNLRKF